MSTSGQFHVFLVRRTEEFTHLLPFAARLPDKTRHPTTSNFVWILCHDVCKTLILIILFWRNTTQLVLIFAWAQCRNNMASRYELPSVDNLTFTSMLSLWQWLPDWLMNQIASRIQTSISETRARRLLFSIRTAATTDPLDLPVDHPQHLHTQVPIPPEPEVEAFIPAKAKDTELRHRIRGEFAGFS